MSYIDGYDIYVNTQPMADKLDAVSQRVDSTTEAVAIMESAVIAQERSSAEQVCNKLDVGFFNMVMSQIAQRMADESAKGRALTVEMIQQQKTLQNLQSRMTNDYNMISSRYAKLFGSLNQELRNRVGELDKPLMEFCSQNVTQLQNRIYNLVSSVPVLQSESLAASQAIAAARLKTNAQKLISAISDYVKSYQKQQQTTDSVQSRSAIKECTYYAPMILSEEDTELTKGNLRWADNPTLKKTIGETVYAQTLQALNGNVEKLEWKENEDESPQIANCYYSMVENSQLPERLKNMMRSIFNDKFVTL